MKVVHFVLMAVLAMLASAVAAEDRGYTEGTVTEVSSIQITSGHFSDYVAYLHKQWVPEQEALKKAKLIVDYSVYTTSRRGPHDPDMYLTITYPNMAAFDGFDDRADAVTSKISGGMAAQEKGVADRNSYRTILGSELIREIKIK